MVIRQAAWRAARIASRHGALIRPSRLARNSITKPAPQCDHVRHLPLWYAQPISARSFTSSEKGKEREGSLHNRITDAKAKRSGLIISKRAGNAEGSTTIANVLQDSVSRKAFSRYVTAIDEATGQAYALSEAWPSQCTTLRCLAVDDDDQRARDAVWWTTSFLLNASLSKLYGSERPGAYLVASPSQIVDAGGFAIQFVVPRAVTQASSPSSHATNTRDQCSSIIRSEASRAARLLQDVDLSRAEKDVLWHAQDLARRSGPFLLERVSLPQARELFASNPFKLEELSSWDEEALVPIARTGDFSDVVPRGIAPSTNVKCIRALKLYEASTATWKPTVATAAQTPLEQALVRIRGISFSSERELRAFEAKLEEARSLDHRVIGQAQQLFFTHEASPGTPFMLPHGMRIAEKIERVIRDLYRRWDYDVVLTPQVYKASLWKQSGHWDNYRDDMFAVEGFKEMQERNDALAHEHNGSCGDSAHAHAGAIDNGKEDADDATFGLKPMNCPGHCLLFASQNHSYRDLPIRYAEFSPLHRNEASGALSGLTRVRRFHQDDAHVFCRLDQVFDEIASMLTMLRQAYTLFGFEHFELALSTRPPQYLGELQDWERAEDALRQALDASGLNWTMNEGDGAFYGPKIDVRLVDASMRRHQTATIQLDFQLPRRFGLRYTGSESKDVGTQDSPPIMIHRAILGSMERFMAILIEHTRGKWPFWLSPRQAVIIPVNTQDQALVAFAKEARDYVALGTSLSARDPSHHSHAEKETHRTPHTFHVEIDASNETLSKRIRRAQLARVNYICVVGQDELASRTLRVRSRDPQTNPEEAEDSDMHQATPDKAERYPPSAYDLGLHTLGSLRNFFIELDDWHR